MNHPVVLFVNDRAVSNILVIILSCGLLNLESSGRLFGYLS
jgi:hypothetical protein